jgi:TonB family protein
MELKNIEMSFICPQNWDSMSVCSNGRFCTVCQKTVFDFTQKSQAEYEAIVQENGGDVCGRYVQKQTTANFGKGQPKSYLRNPKLSTPSRVFRDVPSVNFAKAAAFAVFTLVTTGVEAQTQAVVGKKTLDRTYTPQAVVGYSIASKSEPEYIGGQTAMVEFLKKHIRYKKALQAQGIVHVSFTVETNGQLTNIKVSKGLHPPYDEEAVRLVKLMSGKWKCSYSSDSPYKTEHTIQIKFPME